MFFARSATEIAAERNIRLYAIKQAALAAAIAGAAVAHSVIPATAGVASDPRGEWKRFQHCQALKTAGTRTHIGTASGTVTNIGNNGSGFHTRACFTSQAECETWVSRIGHEIPALDTLRHASCKPV